MTAESINILLLNQHAVGGALPSGVNYYSYYSTVATVGENLSEERIAYLSIIDVY
jgi:hypothetical protein